MLSIRYDSLFRNNNLITKLNEYFRDKKILNIFIDTKNAIFRPHLESELKMLNATLEISHIISSYIKFILLIKKQFANHFEKINIYFYGEHGQSGYHKNIYKEYKMNRKAKDSYSRNLKNLDSIIHVSSLMSKEILNHYPNVFFIYTPYLEMDAMTYYIIKNHQKEEYNGNIILSGDKDNLQIVEELKNVLIIDKGIKRNKNFNASIMVISQKNYLKRILKKDVYTPENKDFLKGLKDNKWLLLYRAIVGDTSDNIKGIHGLGEKRAFKILKICYENNFLKPFYKYRNEIVNNGFSKTFIFKENIYSPEYLDELLNELVSLKKIKKTDKKYVIKLYENQDIIFRNTMLYSYYLMTTKLKNKFEEIYLNYIENYVKVKKPQEFMNFLYDSNLFIKSDIIEVGYLIKNYTEGILE